MTPLEGPTYSRRTPERRSPLRPPLDALVVFAIIGVAPALFVSEVIPTDVTAMGIVVSLAVLFASAIS